MTFGKKVASWRWRQWWPWLVKFQRCHPKSPFLWQDSPKCYSMLSSYHPNVMGPSSVGGQNIQCGSMTPPAISMLATGWVPSIHTGLWFSVSLCIIVSLCLCLIRPNNWSELLSSVKTAVLLVKGHEGIQSITDSAASSLKRCCRPMGDD